jgi:hypothetical protein
MKEHRETDRNETAWINMKAVGTISYKSPSFELQFKVKGGN